MKMHICISQHRNNLYHRRKTYLRGKRHSGRSPGDARSHGISSNVICNVAWDIPISVLYGLDRYVARSLAGVLTAIINQQSDISSWWTQLWLVKWKPPSNHCSSIEDGAPSSIWVPDLQMRSRLTWLRAYTPFSFQTIRLAYRPGPHLNIKTVFPMYEDSHVKDKTVKRPSYL